MPRAVEDETDDADCEVGVVYLDVVVAAGREYLRGLGFECDQQLLHLGPDLLQPCGQLSGYTWRGRERLGLTDHRKWNPRKRLCLLDRPDRAIDIEGLEPRLVIQRRAGMIQE